jgi:arylsulfatase A-like enzyme
MLPKRPALVLAALTLLAAGTWLAWNGPRPSKIERVILLGFDGAAPNLIGPLLAEGKLPAMQRLIDEGAYGPLRTDRPTKSAIIWNSIATGKTMLKHGIIDWTYASEAGLDVPYTDRKRRVKTYWEILDERGFKTGTLNWWVSYPPFPLRNGWLVSNAFKNRQEAGTVHPPQLFDSLNALRASWPGDAQPEMQRLGIPLWKEADATVPITATRAILDAYGYYVAQDLTVDRASDWLFENRPAQAFSTYFRLVDVTSHLADHYLDRTLYDAAVGQERAGAFGKAEEERIDREFARVLRPLYEQMDRTIAKYLSRMDGKTLLIVCSDHGFRFFQGAYSHANPAQEPPAGVVFVTGPGVVKGQRLSAASIYDIAPTVLYALGQPAASDMDGTVLRGLFEKRFLKQFPVRTIASYESRPRDAAPEAANPEVDKEVLQDLKTLGYIGGPSEKPASPSPKAASPAPRPRKD